MSKYTMGGRSLTDFFRYKLNAAGDAWELLDKLTDTPAETPSRANKAFSLTSIGSTKPQFQSDGTVKLSFTQYDSGKDIFAFLDKVAVPATTSTRPEKKIEDGTTIGGTQAADELILAISYLQHDDDDTPTEIFVLQSVGSISAESGSYETNAEDANMPSFEFVGKKVPKTALSIAAALYETDNILATVSGAQTIALGKGYKRGYYTKHA